MRNLLCFSRIIDRSSQYLGVLLMFLILLAIFVSTGNALSRKIFALSSNALLEIQWYLFSSVFMLGAGYTFLRNAHVRIDFLSSRFSARTRNIIDIICIICITAPLCLLLIDVSLPFVINAYRIGEVSSNPGGLVRWPIYMMVPLGMLLLLVQCLSEIIKRIAFLRGYIADPLADSDEGDLDMLSPEETGAPHP